MKTTIPTSVATAPRTARRVIRWSVSHAPSGSAKTRLSVISDWTTARLPDSSASAWKSQPTPWNAAPTSQSRLRRIWTRNRGSPSAASVSSAPRCWSAEPSANASAARSASRYGDTRSAADGDDEAGDSITTVTGTQSRRSGALGVIALRSTLSAENATASQMSHGNDAATSGRTRPAAERTMTARTPSRIAWPTAATRSRGG